MDAFRFLLVPALAALLAAPAFSQGSATAVGMIIHVTGRVSLQRGQATSDAKLADILYPGDMVTTPAAASVTLMFCPTSEKLTIGKSVTLELKANDIRIVKGKDVSRSPARCLLPQVALGSESLERMGAFRARGLPPVTQFVGGALSTNRPVFEWAPVDGATSYRLRLKEAEQDTFVWETHSSSTVAPFPASQPALEDGKAYQWELVARADGQSLAQSSVNFEIKSPATPMPEQDDDLTQALALEAAGYFTEAAAFFRKIRHAVHGDPRITRHLAWLYWNAGLLEAFKLEKNSLNEK